METFGSELRVYALEEIAAENLRAILQHAQKLEERGWSRSRARDHYDLWLVLPLEHRLQGRDIQLHHGEEVASVGSSAAGVKDDALDALRAQLRPDLGVKARLPRS